MIVVDSSALIAILEKEDDAARYAAAIEQAERLSHIGDECSRNWHGLARAPWLRRRDPDVAFSSA